MSILNRLKENILFIGLLFGMVLLDLLEPIGRIEGWMLIFYGMAIVELDRRFNQHRVEPEAGPYQRWDEMHAGDRLEYFFPALFVIVLGTLVLILAVFASGSITDKWQSLAIAALVIGSGIWITYDKWRNRWNAVEND